MPLYEYRCQKCGQTFEKIQKFSDPSLTTCEKCGGLVERLISAPAIQFKGSGWYITDYARKSAGGEKGEAKTPTVAEGKKETASSTIETKTSADK